MKHYAILSVDSSWIYYKLPILPHFDLCWLKKLTLVGAYAVSIQNSMYGSRLFINEDLEDIEDYKNGLDPSQLSVVTCSQRLGQVSYSSQPTSEDRFLYNAQVKSLSELCELKKECVCVTVATITKFLVDNGWIYESCPKCNKKVECEKFPYTCQCCGNESATTVARYKIYFVDYEMLSFGCKLTCLSCIPLSNVAEVLSIYTRAML
ncbi:hypothetical protein glysoja_048444 [Glycine soja]|uniref:Replication factor A C-terminal domain-containing protein n=2 Tax=Glycine subgen. Soja TaxID=1462606 RepID=A0A0B2PNX0_GLYSO|nr:hypothetical protein glysoja_048444 [Glycine soja]